MPECAIEVENLVKKYKSVTAVDNISFKVKKGELFAFLGPNGAGKTTTVEIIETIRKPTSGNVRLLGLDVIKDKMEIVRRIGVLPQEFSSFDNITVRETVNYYSKLFGSKTDIDKLIELVNLTDKRNERYRNLSGGLKQRLGIAIALVNDPEVVFLDEPTTGLDPRARREVWAVLQGLKKEGKTIFLTTHYMEEAELLADTVAIISKGKVIAIDSPRELVDKNTEHLLLTLRGVDKDSNLPNNVYEMLSKIGYNTRYELEKSNNSNGDLKIKFTKNEDLLSILNLLKDMKICYKSLDVRKPNLEEVFLKLTGETLHKEAKI
ncbi:MAG: ABC transporter ATP-binding protein [Thermoplasmata archaeon]